MYSNYSYLGKYASKEKKQPEPKVESENYIIKAINQIQSNLGLYNKISQLSSVCCDCWDKLLEYNIPEINIVLTITCQILDNKAPNSISVVPYKNNLYYYFNTQYAIVSEINKNVIIKKITEESIRKKFEKLFNIIYDYLETNKHDISVIYIYLCYIARNNANINNLLISFPDFISNTATNQTCIRSFSNQFIYKLYNHTAMISFNGYNEMFPFNLDFFIRHMYISIESQYEEDVTTFISLLKKHIKTSCINHSTPQSTIYYDIYKSGVMTQNYKLEVQNSTCILKSISDSINEQSNHTLEPFRPICLYNNSALHTVVNNHSPKTLYTYLISMCSNKPTLDTIIKIITTSLMSINIKRKVAIITCNEKNVDSVKMFFKKILTINDNTYKAVIDEGFDAINLNKPGFKEELRALNYSNAKALFLSNTREKFSVNKLSGIIEKAKPLLMQTFIFQLDTIESTFSQKDCLHLDLSRWIPPENCTFSDNDALWAKIYLPIYGLHILFKDRKNTNKFDFPDVFESKKIIFEERDNIIQKLCSDFIGRYFVSADKAQKRKHERKAAIQDIKKQNPGCTDEIIIKQLDKSLEFSTFDEDFETYTQLYLDTQCSSTVIEQYKITVTDIKKCLIDKQTFRHCEVSVMYTGKNYFKKMGFKYLSLIEPWEITKQKMLDNRIQPEENDVTSNDMEIAIQKLIDILPSVIDMKPLSQCVPFQGRLVTSD